GRQIYVASGGVWSVGAGRKQGYRRITSFSILSAFSPVGVVMLRRYTYTPLPIRSPCSSSPFHGIGSLRKPSQVKRRFRVFTNRPATVNTCTWHSRVVQGRLCSK